MDNSGHKRWFLSRQHSILFRDENAGRAWPMESPNPNARDMEAAKKLIELSYGLVGLKFGAEVEQAAT
jgi:hypothetical protein